MYEGLLDEACTIYWFPLCHDNPLVELFSKQIVVWCREEINLMILPTLSMLLLQPHKVCLTNFDNQEYALFIRVASQLVKDELIEYVEMNLYSYWFITTTHSFIFNFPKPYGKVVGLPSPIWHLHLLRTLYAS